MDFIFTKIMCLAIPARIIECGIETAVADTSGVRREIILNALDQEVRVGDYVLVHAGFAIRKLNIDEAKKTLEAHKHYREAMEENNE